MGTTRTKEAVMQYLMLIYRDRDPAPPVPTHSLGEDVEAWVTRMNERGIRLAGAPVAADREAVTVRVRAGSTAWERSAFLDTGGALLGFDLLDCRDQEEAIAVAAEHPLAARRVMELRPLAAD
jgi:hypothetical protein